MPGPALPVALKCPSCGRFLAEVTELGVVVCRDCGCEVRYRSRERRRQVPMAEEASREDLSKAAAAS